MTEREKKRKAAMIAVAYHLEQEAKAAVNDNQQAGKTAGWSRIGREISMSKRSVVQRRGRTLHGA